MEQKRALSFPLRLCPSVRQQATQLAQNDKISLNHFISLAVAEKISRMEHANYLRMQSKGLPDSAARPRFFPSYSPAVKRPVSN